MLEKFAKRKSTIITYIVISLFLIALSCISLFFNEWVLIPCVAVCSLFGLFNTLFLISSEQDVGATGPKGTFALFSVFRYISMILGMVISGLLIYLTMGEEIESIRYIMVAIAALPYFGTTLSYLLSTK